MCGHRFTQEEIMYVKRNNIRQALEMWDNLPTDVQNYAIEAILKEVMK
jgi:hypothetical protein